MASTTDRENSLPPGKKPRSDAPATREDPDAPSPQLASTSQGSRSISTSLYRAIKKVKADLAIEEDLRRRDQGLNGGSSNAALGTLLPKRLFAPLDYSPGFEVSHIRTRLESSPEEEAESDDTEAEEQGEARIYRYTEKSSSTEEDELPLGFYFRLKRTEASLDPQSESEDSDREESSESDAGGETVDDTELEHISAPEDEQPIVATEEVDDQPTAAGEAVANVNPNRGEYLSPIISPSKSLILAVVLPFPENRDAIIDYLLVGVSLCRLLPSSVDSKGRVTCNADRCLNEDGNWVIEDEECGGRLSSTDIYFRHVKTVHLGIQRDTKIAEWAKKFRPEAGTLPANRFRFVVEGPNDLKRKIAHRESMIGSRGKRQKK